MTKETEDIVMDERLIPEIKNRWDKCRIEAAARGFDALMVVGQGTERVGI